MAHNGINHGKRNKDDGDRLQEAAQEQQDKVYSHENYPAVYIRLGNNGHKRLRHLQGRKNEAEEHSTNHDGKNHGGGADRGDENLIHIPQ